MEIQGKTRLGRALAHRRSVVATALLVAAAVVLGGGVVLATVLSGGSAATASPSQIALASATPVATPTLAPTPTPTEEPTASPTPMLVAATTDGVLLPADQAALATRHPIAVMIDDHVLARPQAGLSQADIVYQAPAEAGIPRYMAIFQTQTPALIGPVRSSRLYFVAWASEWRAAYVHQGGATNALQFIGTLNGKYVFNVEGNNWGGARGYLWRVGSRISPHNVYTSAPKLLAVCAKVGATAPYAKGQWTFADASAPDARAFGGTITVPYPANKVSYVYDRTTNTYPRSVTGEGPEIDAGNGVRIAPSNVVVLYEPMGPLLGSNNAKKHRIEVGYTGTGRAVVFSNGLVIAATWSKKSDTAPTLLTYATGDQAGQPVNLVRGQIFVQVVPTDMNVSWTTGLLPPPQH